MRSVARTRTFDITWYVPTIADINECKNIILIAMFTILVIKISTLVSR